MVIFVDFGAFYLLLVMIFMFPRNFSLPNNWNWALPHFHAFQTRAIGVASIA